MSLGGGGSNLVMRTAPCCRQHRVKYNVSYNDKDDTWSYHQKLIHVFDPVQSAPFTENDRVTVIHPALMVRSGPGKLSAMLSAPHAANRRRAVHERLPICWAQVARSGSCRFGSK